MSDPEIVRLGFSASAEPKVPFRRLHGHDEIEIGVNARFPVVAMFGGRTVTLPPRHLVVFWAGRPHGPVKTTRGGWAYGVHIPLAWFLGWRLPEPFARRLLEGEVFIVEPRHASTDDLALVKNWVDLMRLASAEARKIVLLEVEARLRRVAADMPRGKGRESAGDPTRFEQLAAHIANHYREPLTVRQITRACGLGESHGMRLFRRTSGMTLLEYLTQLRVSHAQQLLLGPRRKLLDIALESGFGSPARFYAAFKAATGRSPGQYRAAMQGGIQEPTER